MLMGVGLSLVGVKTISELERIANTFPECSFELSYYSTPEFLENALPLLSGRIVSVHSLTPKREFFPNLGWQGAMSWSEREILFDAGFSADLGAKRLVLHPGYAIESLLYTDAKKRMKQVATCAFERFCLPGHPTIAGIEYLKSPDYKKAFDIMAENAKVVSAKVQSFGLSLCLENLPSRPGYLLIHPDEMVALAKEGLKMCLDIGHLQLSGAALGFDFVRQSLRVLESGGVETMHVHSNPSQKGLYEDTHENPLRYNNRLKKIVDCAKANGVELISEVTDDPYDSVAVLTSMYGFAK